MADTSQPTINEAATWLRAKGLKDEAAIMEALAAERDALAERVRVLVKAGDWLATCAQTTGGVPGPDAILDDAIETWVITKGPTP